MNTFVSSYAHGGSTARFLEVMVLFELLLLE